MKFERKTFRKYLAIASDIIPKLPDRSDGFLKTVIKLMGILDSFDKQLGKPSALFDFFSKLDADAKRNKQLVDLFFSTDILDTFKVSRISLSDYMDIVIADDAVLGTIYFLEYHWSGKAEPASEFWHSDGFKFEKVLERLWGMLNNGIQIGLSFDQGLDSPKTVYKPLIFTKDPHMGSAVDDLNKLVQNHKKFAADGFSRTYMFVGKQGVGKSTFATRMAQACGTRVLQIDARGMTVAGVNDLSFLIGALVPDFVIVDDIDRLADQATSVPMLLGTLSELKARHPTVTAILTVNDISVFDAAILRPGRVDKVVEFSDPDETERTRVFAGYLQEFNSKCSDIPTFIKELEGLTASYIREIAIQLRYIPEDEVLGTIRQMRTLAEKAKGGAKPANTTPSDPKPS